MTELRMYQGPKQEKHYRKQRQLLQREQEVLAMPDEHKQLVPIEKPVLDIPRIVVPSNNKGQTDWSIILYAYAVYFVAMSINASVAYKLGTTAVDKVEMAVLGAMFETGLFLLPDKASTLWKQHRWIHSIVIWITCLPISAAVLMANLQFASLNLTEAATARAERITPAVSDAERRLDAITASKKDECVKRGDRCRQLDKDEQHALEALRMAREKVSEASDPFSATASKLAGWVNVHPSPEDISLFRLFLFTIIPVFSGVFKMAARKS